MRQRANIILTICTGSLIAPLGSAEPVAFPPLGGGAGATPQRAVAQQQESDAPGMAFCVRFGDSAEATAMPGPDELAGPVTLGAGGGEHPMLSAHEARHVLWSWAFGPVAEASEDADTDIAAMYMIDGGLDAATLGQGFSAIPDLGDDSRTIGFLQTSDSYTIDGGEAGFVVMRSQPPIVVPLPNAAALAAAGLLVLGARRRT